MSDRPGAPVLPPCPSSPNCRSSEASDAAHAVAPLRYDGDPARARAALGRALASLPRTRVVLDEPRRLRAECRSLIFRFVDDLDLVMDDTARLVHVRSASRVGHSDFGVNARRIEHLRAAFARELAGS